MRFILFSLTIGGTLLSPCAWGLETDESALESQFRKEAPLGWGRLKAKHGATHFEWRTTESSSDSSQAARTTNGSICYRGDLFVARRDLPNKSKIWGGNDRYIFTISRSSSEDPWALNNYGPLEGSSASDGDEQFGAGTRNPWQIFNRSCDELIADPSFRIQRLKKNADGSVDLHFSVSPREQNEKAHITSGQLVLLPDRDWAISQSEARLTRPTRPSDPPIIVVTSCALGPDNVGFLNLKHTVNELRWKSGVEDRWRREETDWNCRRCQEPVASFSLTGYGIPEPALLERDSGTTGRPWLWLNVIAIVCLVAALVMRYRLNAREVNRANQ